MRLKDSNIESTWSWFAMREAIYLHCFGFVIRLVVTYPVTLFSYTFTSTTRTASTISSFTRLFGLSLKQQRYKSNLI